MRWRYHWEEPTYFRKMRRGARVIMQSTAAPVVGGYQFDDAETAKVLDPTGITDRFAVFDSWDDARRWLRRRPG